MRRLILAAVFAVLVAGGALAVVAWGDPHCNPGHPELCPAPTPTPTPTVTVTATATPTPTPTPPPPSGFPDASNTGIPAGTTLTSSGSINVTTDGQTIDALDVNGTITVSANNVTIQNSRAHEIRNQGNDVVGLLVQDSEVDCGGGGTGIWSHHMTVLRVEITRCENGMSDDNDVIVRDSFIHALAGEAGNPDPHIDGIQGLFGPNIVVDHNTIVAFNTSAVNIFNDFPPLAHDVRVTNNRLIMTDDHIVVYCPRYDYGAPEIYVNGNRIDDANHSGLTDSCIPGSTITEFNGNVVDSTGAPIAPG